MFLNNGPEDGRLESNSFVNSQLFHPPVGWREYTPYAYFQLEGTFYRFFRPPFRPAFQAGIPIPTTRTAD
ncbi:predicted protein [Botrytis cinerea T4]|uniref:Uncharacterized protein n=1 Tax=Botryotinia fuckeliana (strain T4) TaxID=999810 RepID=G2YQ54_BOTF4|nr:predicted protein [Botrytis cinerea T4]